MPLTEVNGEPIGRGKRSKVTERLMAAYKEAVAKETKQGA
jgi:hypothetical protein